MDRRCDNCEHCHSIDESDDWWCMVQGCGIAGDEHPCSLHQFAVHHPQDATPGEWSRDISPDGEQVQYLPEDITDDMLAERERE